MGAGCSLAARGWCGAGKEHARKKGKGRDASAKRRSHRNSPAPPHPGGAVDSGLLASNQDAAFIQRTGHMSTICHKIGSEVSQEPNICGRVVANCTLVRGKPGSSLLPIIDDGDFCPTCLEGYHEEHPKIVAKCKHHFHLSCILAWKERSDKCPICDKMMVYDSNDGL